MPQTIEAVLLRVEEEEPVIVRRFARPRLRSGERAMAEDFATSLPGLKSSEDTDFTLQVGSGAGSLQDDLDLDLDPSLQRMGGSDVASGDGSPMQGERSGPRVFPGALSEILKECEHLGHPNPKIIFVAGQPDIAHVEISGDPETMASSQNWMDAAVNFLPFGGDKRDSGLTAALRSAYAGPLDTKRVGFLPMTPTESGTPRHLALIPTPSDSVTPTANVAFGPQSDVSGSVSRLDAEITLHVDTVQRYLVPDEDHTTALVRVGSEDTLILFMNGPDLLHVEQPRSLTSYDAPDTIASRVLLYQDEQQIDGIDAVVLVGGTKDDRLVRSFRTLFPDAAVGRLHELLVGEHVAGNPDILAMLTPDSGIAIAAGLRLIKGPGDDLNLIGVTTRQKKRTMPVFAWHTVLMLLALIGVTLFFVSSYVSQRSEISELRNRIEANPVALPDISPADLQQRVDSLNAVHAQYARSLYVLDSLLVGSTEWSTSIERTANQTEAIEGIWFEEWSIKPNELTIRGNALDRNRAATFARNLEGVVHEVVYADIEDRRVYQFEITIPRMTELPEAARYLRERNLDSDAAESIVSANTIDASGPSTP